jgi:predicted lipid-binding transport protein (Tim44 family)
MPVGNPIANILVVIAGVLAIGVSIVLGFFAIVALGALILVTAAVIGLRVWWFNRKLRQQSPSDRDTARRKPPAGVIEGEYRVVDQDSDEA